MRPLVFISGWGTTAQAWRQVVAGIGGRHPCFFFSWRDALPSGDSLSRKLAEFSAPVILVGWSLGGLLALQAACLSASIAGLVLVAATARMTAAGDYPGVPAAALRGMILKMRRHRQAVLRDFAANASFPRNDAGWEEDFLTQSGSFATAELIHGLEFLAGADLRDSQARITVPAHILHGDNDRIVPAAQARHLHLHLPNSSLTLIEGGGHILPHTHPRTLIQKIEMLENA
ncbi:MAG: alpha/beta fold hydrolase [Deltaproteobacteria bacterium]|mgnify:CR=1 FL=1|nr:alpha/beta fold hydrolase [Deltaproteobacteria bacterium]